MWCGQRWDARELLGKSLAEAETLAQAPWLLGAGRDRGRRGLRADRRLQLVAGERRDRGRRHRRDRQLGLTPPAPSAIAQNLSSRDARSSSPSIRLVTRTTDGSGPRCGGSRPAPARPRAWPGARPASPRAPGGPAAPRTRAGSPGCALRGLGGAAVAIRMVLLDQPPVGVERRPPATRRAGRRARGTGPCARDQTYRSGNRATTTWTELTRRLQAQLGDRLLAAWVVGSSALGDFDAARSDVDVQAVSNGRLDPRGAARARRRSSPPSSAPCAGWSSCSTRARTWPTRAARRSASTSTPAPAWTTTRATTRTPSRASGSPSTSRSPASTRCRSPALTRARSCPSCRAAFVLARLRDSLTWWGAFGGAQAVLAACRALAWTQTGRWLSKGEAGRYVRRPDRRTPPSRRATIPRGWTDAEEVASILDRVDRHLQPGDGLTSSPP